MATPHFLTIPLLLHGFRAVAAVPRRLAENCADVIGLAVSPLPIEIEGFDVSMLWHARTDTDPAQRWFRDLVRLPSRARRADRGHAGARATACEAASAKSFAELDRSTFAQPGFRAASS
jgi:hypothetical protein